MKMKQPKYPPFVVVDTLDGTVIVPDDEADSVAWRANFERKPGSKTYHVFQLVPVETLSYDGPEVASE